MLFVPLSPALRNPTGLARSFDRYFDDSYSRLVGNGAGSDGAQRSPSLDVTETERGYSVIIEMPGVAKEDVKIAIDGRRVSVSAQSQRTEGKADAGRVIYRERAAASFARTLTLPEEVDQQESQAKLDNGVLHLILAKKRAAVASHLTIS